MSKFLDLVREDELKDPWTASSRPPHKCRKKDGWCVSCLKAVRKFISATLYARHYKGEEGVEKLITQRKEEARKGIPFRKRTLYLDDAEY